METIQLELMQSHINAFKTVRSLVSKSDLIQWFNDNDIEYYHLNDIDMYIKYMESNNIYAD